MDNVNLGQRFHFGFMLSQMVSKGYISLLIVLFTVLNGAIVGDRKSTETFPTVSYSDSPATTAFVGENHTTYTTIDPKQLGISEATFSLLCYVQCMAKCEDIKVDAFSQLVFMQFDV